MRLTVFSNKRQDFVHLGAHLAMSIEPRFLHDPSKILHIQITGDLDSGKSLLAEAMFKYWMDDFSLSEKFNIPASNKFFLESAPCEAQIPIEIVKYSFGKPAIFVFSSTLYDSAYEEKQVIEEKLSSKNIGGVFVSTQPFILDGPECDIVISLPHDVQRRFRNRIDVTIINENLKTNELLQESFKRLKSFRVNLSGLPGCVPF